MVRTMPSFPRALAKGLPAGSPDLRERTAPWEEFNGPEEGRRAARKVAEPAHRAWKPVACGAFMFGSGG